MNKFFLFTLIAALSINLNYSQQLAFPTAVGAGAYTTGGRGGEVLHVTTLDWNDNPGSLKWAIKQTFTRTIVFDVSGEIDATSETNFGILIQGSQYNNFTIAGQTAPEGGISIRTSFFGFKGVDNFIIRHVRFRNSDAIATSDAFWLFDCNQYIMDHCTFSHGKDETFDMGSSQGRMGDITVQRCFFQDSKTGAIAGTDTRGEPVPLDDLGDITFAYNCWTNISHRFPNPQGKGQYDIVNNVVYNWKNRLIRITQDGDYNIVNNYYKPAANGLRRPGWFGNGTISTNFLQRVQLQTGETQEIYAAGNIIEGDRDVPQADDRVDFSIFAGSSSEFTVGAPVPDQYFVTTQFPLKGEDFPILSAHDAYDDVLADVGCNKRINDDGSIATNIDSRDTNRINEILNDSYNGSFFDPINSIPYPIIPQNTRPGNFYDTNPHIPQIYLDNRGITGSATVHNEVQVSGYTLLEEYINQVDVPGETLSTLSTQPEDIPLIGKNYKMYNLLGQIIKEGKIEEDTWYKLKEGYKGFHILKIENEIVWKTIF